MRTNLKATVPVVDERLAGGFGPHGAAQGDEATLRRLTMACLLWEDVAYADGKSVADEIARVVPLVAPDRVAAIASEARFGQKLRHVPLWIAREMCRHDSHRTFVADVLADVVHRPDELTEFLSLYWKDGRTPIAKQMKRGLARAFVKFDAYQLAKWNRDTAVKLRDVLFLVHPKPKDDAQAAVWKQLVDGTLAAPDTWEVGLSAAKGADEKRAVWERLLADRKLGAFALLKNLRNMQQAAVPRASICEALSSIKPDMLLPLDFLKAAKYAPDLTREIEDAMLKCAATWPKLPGRTLVVIDVSGSMATALSAQSEFTRIDAAAAIATLASEVCESAAIYVTAGCDGTRRHKTEAVGRYRGLGLAKAISDSARSMGGGGIFTRQCLEHLRAVEKEQPDRIIIFSDSQDCDLDTSRPPRPFGKRNYIIDISSHSHGVNYAGCWTAEISGWSDRFLAYIAAMEGARQ